MISCVSPCTSSTNPSSCDSQPTIGGCDTVPGTSSFLAKTAISGTSACGTNLHMHQQVPSVEGMSSSASPAVARSVPPSEPHYPESAAKVVYLTTEMANQAAIDYELEKFENIFEWLKTYKDSSNKENAPNPSSPLDTKPSPQPVLIPEKKAVKRMREEDDQEENERATKKPALESEPDSKLHEIGSMTKEEAAPVVPPPMDENPLKRMERLTSSSNFSQPSTLSEVMEVPKKDDRCTKQDKEQEQMKSQIMEHQHRMFQHQQHQMAMMAAHHQAAKSSPNPNQPQFPMQMGPHGPIPHGAMPSHPGGPYPPHFMMHPHAARMMAAAQMGKGSPGGYPMMSPHHGMPHMPGHPAFRPGMPPMHPGMPSPQQQQQMMAQYMQMRGIPPHAMNGMPPFHPGHPMFGAPGMPGGPMGSMGPMGMPGGPGFPGNIPRAPSAAMASPSHVARPPSSSMGPGAPNSVPTSQAMMSPFHGMIPPGGLQYPHQMRPGQGTPLPGPSSVASGDPMHSGMPGTGTPITGPTYPQPMPGQMPHGMHTPSSGPGFSHSGPGGPPAHMLNMGQHPGMLQAAPPMSSAQVRPGESFPQYQFPQHFADQNAL